MAGRRPKSSRERELGGLAGHRPLPADPKPTLGWPRRPKGLDKVGRRQWKVLAGILDAEHRLTTSDGPALEGAARAYQVWLWTWEQAQGVKLTIETAQGTKAHPAHTVLRAAGDAYRKWLNDLTVTPGTRARARVPQQDDGSKPNSLKQLQAQGRALRRVV